MSGSVKTILHDCGVRHKTYRTASKCEWPRAHWWSGEGPFVTLAYCRGLTVELHPTLEAAEEAKAIIDSSGCGGACQRRHRIVKLELPR